MVRFDISFHCSLCAVRGILFFSFSFFFLCFLQSDMSHFFAIWFVWGALFFSFSFLLQYFLQSHMPHFFRIWLAIFWFLQRLLSFLILCLRFAVGDVLGIGKILGNMTHMSNMFSHRVGTKGWSIWYIRWENMGRKGNLAFLLQCYKRTYRLVVITWCLF